MTRFEIIIVGFLAAVMASSATMAAMSFAVNMWESPQQDWVGVLAISPVWVLFLAVFVCVLSFLPCFLFVLLAEFVPIRNPFYYTIAGGLTGIVAYSPFWIIYQPFWGYIGKVAEWHGWTGRPGIPSMGEHAGLFVCGFVGGLAYWAISGRSAGRRKPTSPAPSGS